MGEMAELAEEERVEVEMVQAAWALAAAVERVGQAV
jgi:hypothetical protein